MRDDDLERDAPPRDEVLRLVDRAHPALAEEATFLRTLAAGSENLDASIAAAKGAGDFVIEVASELPLQAIAELIGIPTIVVVGKGLADGLVEIKDRRSGERREVPVAEAVDAVLSEVRGA